MKRWDVKREKEGPFPVVLYMSCSETGDEPQEEPKQTNELRDESTQTNVRSQACLSEKQLSPHEEDGDQRGSDLADLDKEAGLNAACINADSQFLDTGDELDNFPVPVPHTSDYVTETEQLPQQSQSAISRFQSQDNAYIVPARLQSFMPVQKKGMYGHFSEKPTKRGNTRPIFSSENQDGKREKTFQYPESRVDPVPACLPEPQGCSSRMSTRLFEKTSSSLSQEASEQPSIVFKHKSRRPPWRSSKLQLPSEVFTTQNKIVTEDGGLDVHTPTSTSGLATCSQFILIVEHQGGSPVVSPTTAGHSSTIDGNSHLHLPDFSPDPLQRSGESRPLSRPHSLPSLNQIPSIKNKKYTQAKRSQSLPDMMLQESFVRFTPDISADENRETYRFQCTSPGLYQCRVTGLVFNMEGEGDVTYRIVPWNRRLLAQNHKKPAGPLFDIKCQQQSVCQLHLPHCEIHSTGGCKFLSVAHVTDGVTDFIRPHKITETHAIIKITGFSDFGIVKDENSTPDPIPAVVLALYSPPVHPDLTSRVHVLLLPGNIVLRDVLHKRKETHGDEVYLKTSLHCKLHPKQEYTLSSSPEGESILIQPQEAEFDSEINENYITTFDVHLEEIMKNITLLLKDHRTSRPVWERRLCLSSSAITKSQVQSDLSLPSDEMLTSIRSRFIKRTSGPVLKSLLDKLFEKKVINDSERETAGEFPNRADKARCVIDMVINKGKRASSIMIQILCKEDPFLSEKLGLNKK